MNQQLMKKYADELASQLPAWEGKISQGVLACDEIAANIRRILIGMAKGVKWDTETVDYFLDRAEKEEIYRMLMDDISGIIQMLCANPTFKSVLNKILQLKYNATIAGVTQAYNQFMCDCLQDFSSDYAKSSGQAYTYE